MSQDLEQLKDLVFAGGFDEESQQSVLALESQLQDLAVKEKLAEHPAIKPFLDWALSRLDEAELLLKSKRELTDRERDALFERIDVCDHFLTIFGKGSARASLEQTIKDTLAQAKVA